LPAARSTLGTRLPICRLVWQLGQCRLTETIVEPRIPAKLVAEAVVYMANLPLEANIPFVTIMASGMPLSGRGKQV
jgi:hypothetical protein